MLQDGFFSLLFTHISLLARIHCYESLVGLRPLVSPTITMLDSHWILLGYTVITLCPGDSAGLGLQDRLLHVLQQIMDWVNVEVGQLTSLVLGLSSCRVGQSVSSPLSHHEGELSINDLANLPLVAFSKATLLVLLFSHSHSGLSPSYTIRDVTQKRCRATVPSATAEERQGQLSDSYDLRTSSPTCHRW